MNFLRYFLGRVFSGLLFGLTLSMLGVSWLLISNQITLDASLILIINVTTYIIILHIFIGTITFLINRKNLSSVDTEKYIEYEKEELNDNKKSSAYVEEVIYTLLIYSVYSTSCVNLSVLNNYIYIWDWTPSILLKTLTIDYSWFYGNINAGIWGYFIGVSVLILTIYKEFLFQRDEIKDFYKK
jgi:hypothetical protein